MQLEDCYRVLDVDPRATDEEVKTAWRDLAKAWHPDRFGHDPDMQSRAEEKLKSINEAYERIRDHRDVAPASRQRFPALAVMLAFGALLILLRRPTIFGLAVAMVLFAIAIVCLRMRV